MRVQELTLRAQAAVVLVLILCVAATPPTAQESLTLTLEEAVARGLSHSARLAELEARQAGAAAAGDARAAAKLPIAAVQAGYTRTNHVDEYSIAAPGQAARILYPDVPNNYRTRLDLQWPIYTAGRSDALERAARAEASAIGEDLAAARADLRLEITRAFWALVTARETERVVSRSLASLDAHVSDLQVRLDQGLIPPNDVLSARAQRSRQRVLSIEAANTRAIAEADLRRLIGVDESVTVSPPDSWRQAPPPAAAAAGTTTLAAADSRADARRRALDQRLGAARERETAARAAGKPQIVVAGGYDYARPNPRIFPRTDLWHDSWDASVNVSWTLWDGGRRAAEQAEAAAATRAMEARITELDRQIAFDIEARRLELDSSRAAIAAAEDGVASAVEARRVVGERYRAGVVTSTDVLDAEIAVLQAELDRTRAVATARLAEARLERALGR